jgi:two-component system, NarL family, sensor kinase
MTEADLRAEIEDLRQRLAEAEAELEDRRQFVAQVMEAEDRARLRIAELIHDDALQSLLAANQDLIEAAPGREQVTRAHEVVSGTIAQLREAMVALHPVTLQQGGLEQALSAIARQAERQSAVSLAVNVELDPAAVGRNNELILAISRELLSNVARHSHARNASVTIRAKQGAVELSVADDGAGMAPERRREALAEGHIGLASVTQRVEANGGELHLDAAPGSGTQVWVRLVDQEPDARP